eukprot:12813470-Alexandrium_andersonii.AAC.1
MALTRCAVEFPSAVARPAAKTASLLALALTETKGLLPAMGIAVWCWQRVRSSLFAEASAAVA